MQENQFLERALRDGILRDLTAEELWHYRAPYLQPGESRRPLLAWPREVPFDGDPTETAFVIDKYSKWMAANDLPKLFIRANPGTVLRGPYLEYARTWKNQTEVTVRGLHFIQEDSPEEIAAAINSWLDEAFRSGSVPSTSDNRKDRPLSRL